MYAYDSIIESTLGGQLPQLAFHYWTKGRLKEEEVICNAPFFAQESIEFLRRFAKERNTTNDS